MAMTPITDLWDLNVHINFAKGGFSEKYHLPMDTIANAKAAAVRIVSFRADLLALGFSIAQASLSTFCKFKDSYVPNGYRYAPINLATEALIANVAPCNDPETGPMWRFDTGLGKFVNRCIRGLRDSWISNNAAVTTTATIGTQVATAAYVAPTPNVTTQQEVIDRYLSTIFWLTRHIKILTKTAFVGGIRTMTGESRDWATVSYRRLSSHDVGARFGVGKGRQPAWA